MSSEEKNAEQEVRPIVSTVVDRDGAGRGAIGQTTGIVVEVIGGPMDGEQHRAGGRALSIGRAEENDLPLPLDLSVSTHHARIVHDEGQFWLEDLGSTNGSFVGDTQIKGKAVIGPGTVFVIGRTTLELMSS